MAHRLPGTTESQLVCKREVQPADKFALRRNAACRITKQRRQPLAAALAQKGLFGTHLRGKVSRRSRLSADNGLQIAAIMPHLHRSQIRWSSVNSSRDLAASLSSRSSGKLATGIGSLQTIELQCCDDEVSTASRRHSSPAPILDEFPPGRLLKTFGVKGRKP
jgi:hypothetical protein